jgi:hypothetical protein
MKKKPNKNLTLKKSKVVVEKDELDGDVIVNGKQLTLNKDYFLTKEGIKLSKETEILLEDKNTKNYGFFFTRSVIKKIK